MIRFSARITTITAIVILSGCAAIPTDKIAAGCDAFRRAEASPTVQLALAAGTVGANFATGGVAGPVVASLRSYGARFCAEGPPAGDTTTEAERLAWLAGVTKGLIDPAAK